MLSNEVNLGLHGVIPLSILTSLKIIIHMHHSHIYHNSSMNWKIINICINYRFLRSETGSWVKQYPTTF